MPKPLQEEIGDMLAGLKSDKSTEEDSAEEASVEETPVEEIPEETSEEADVKIDGEPQVEETTKEEDVEEEPEVKEEEVEVKDETPPVSDELQSMRDQMEAMSGLLLEHGIRMPGAKVEPSESKGKPSEEKVEVPTPKEIKGMSLDELIILAEDLDFDDFINDRETFNGTMKGIFQRFYELIESNLTQNFTSRIPDVVANQVRQVSALQKASNDFYEANPDLRGVRKTVGAVADQVVAENPNLSLDEVLIEAATRTRQLLKLPVPKGGEKVLKPSFANPKGGGQNRKPKKQPSKLQNDIDELID